MEAGGLAGSSGPANSGFGRFGAASMSLASMAERERERGLPLVFGGLGFRGGRSAIEMLSAEILTSCSHARSKGVGLGSIMRWGCAAPSRWPPFAVMQGRFGVEGE